MSTLFNICELEEALRTLKDKKSPENPEHITNEMLKHMGTKSKSKFLAFYNNTGRQDWFLRVGEMVTWNLQKGNDKAKSGSAKPYQSHQLCRQAYGATS
ncbi:hypothetical protein ElyMa_004695000 [Elysia marginata]|uniref:Uncharacterized protein n=1 Tax=Elysia marginata TaxID=1093978 RepID=A0AAV4I9Z9_9GAST|nr:hypothetical protein ElyMa_004695000 [Elysia marginata]